jgi:hypothetical protein
LSLLKGALADRLVVVTAFLVVLLSASLAAAIPIYANAVAESSLRERIDRSAVTAANVQATVNVFSGDADRALDTRVRGVAQDVFGDTDVAIYASGESEPFAAGGRTLVFGFADGVENHARLVSGRWPGSDASTEVAVTEVVARGRGLRPGRAVRAVSRLNANRVVRARVVGLFRAEQPSSAYWWGNPLTTSGAYGPLVTTRKSFFGLGLEDVELRWRFEPALERLTLAQAADLRRRLARLAPRLNEGQPGGQQFALDTNLPEILGDASRSLRLARAGVLVPSIQLLLLAAYGLIVTAALLIERRRLATESLRLRGATTRQIVRMSLLEAALIALPAVALAPWLAAGALRSLNYAGPLADIGLRLDPEVSWSAYVLAAAVGAGCVAGLVLPALGSRRITIVGGGRRMPVADFVQRARLDVVLAVLALLGYWQLRRYHGVLVEHRGGLGIDPFLVTAPALLLLAGALLSLRIVPLLARLVERVVPSTVGAVGALGFWQLARRPRAYTRSVLLLMLAVAIGVFAATYSRTWHRSQVDQAEHVAGADLRIEPSLAPGTPRSLELSSAYRSVGVEEALPVVVDSIELSRSGPDSGTLIAVDAHRGAGVVRVREDFSSSSLREALEPLAAERGELAALRLPGRPTRFALSLDLAVEPLGRPVPFAPESEGPEPLAPASVFLYLRDADGVIYLYRLPNLAPGQTQRYAVELTRRLAGGRPAPPRYPLSLVGLELDVDAPYLAPRRMTLTMRAPLGNARWTASASRFALPYEHPRVERVSSRQGSVRTTFTTGSYLYPPPRPATTEVFLRPGRDSLPDAPRVLASDSFLRATASKVGQVVPLALSAGTQQARIAGSFHRFPTLDPRTPAVVADLPSYYAFSFASRGDVVQPSQWWLKSARDTVVADQLRVAPFRSLEVVSFRERQRALLEDPVPLGVIGALALGFAVAAAFGAVGFAASAAAAARARMLEFAVLRSLGLGTRQLSAWIALESALVVALSLVGGTALGLLVAWLVLPYVGLGTSGATPVPPVEVAVPWSLVLWLELALLAALVAIAAAQVARIRGLRLASVLRSGEGALAP